jgi:hypothetical protein
MLTCSRWAMPFSISPDRPTHNDGSLGASEPSIQIVCDKNPTSTRHSPIPDNKLTATGYT